MSHRLDSLNFHLLTTLGLSHDSAEAVIDRINDLKAEVAAKDSALHQVETRLNDALVELENLRSWKKEALLVESRWDCQRVAKLLGIGLGEDIRPNIEPKIRALLDENARLRLALQQIAGFFDPNSSVHGTAISALGPP